MSSKQFVYLLMMVAIVCGFIASDTAHGQSTGSITVKGTVMEADGTPVAGYAISGEAVPPNPAFNFVGNPSRADGSYDIVAFSFAGGTLSVGDGIKITATDPQGSAVSVTRVLTVDDVNSGIVDPLNIVVGTRVTVESSESQLAADGTSTATLTITVIQGGVGVTGDTVTVTVTANQGTVSAPTDNGDGTYSATYTAPALSRVDPVDARITITAASATTGESGSVDIRLTPVPTTVTVSVVPSMFTAATPSDGAVTVTVDRAGPVADETVTLSLSPAVGSGSVTAVTNNGDGTYSATYTSGGTAGPVTLKATATTARASDSAKITINPGPPAAIALRAAPMTVTSLGSATITAIVTDSAGNGVGGQSLTGATTSGGTLTAFVETPTFGTYVATYSAPTVEAEGTETVTVSLTGIASDPLTLSLTPEPPIPVNIIVIEGKVYKEDGEIPADGVNITVTVGSNPPELRTTGADGSYEVTVVNPLGTAATTGDTVAVSVSVAGSDTTINVVALAVNTVGHSGASFPLVNDILEKVAEGMPVTVDVTTDIVIPPRTANVLVVTGNIYKEDGSTPAGGGLNVAVTVGSDSRTTTTGPDGSYTEEFIDLLNPVATSGDPVSIGVSDGSGPRHNPYPAESTLSHKEVGLTGSATVRRDVTTDIGLTSNILVVRGTVYLKNGDIPVKATSDLRESELTVVVRNTTRNWTQTGVVDAEGNYNVTEVQLLSAVIETDDVIVVEVQDEAGVTVGAADPHTLTIANLQNPNLEIDVKTNVRARVFALAIEGDIVELDGSPAGADVKVTLEIWRDGALHMQQIISTNPSGGYNYTFVDLLNVVARTDDELIVDVLRGSDGYFGYEKISLQSHYLAYENQPLEVIPPPPIKPIKLIPPTLRLGGLSINTSYADEYYGYLSLEAIKKNPELLQLIPSGILHVDLSQNLLASLPAGFNPTPATTNPLEQFEIDSENFGNGITPRPAWHVLAGSNLEPPDSGRWINGNQLNLYVVTGPVPSVQSVTFTLTGPQSGTMEAASVTAASYMHNFQLEEERAILFLPSWPSLNMNAPIFADVTLMIDGQAPVMMTSKLVGDEVVWEAPATLNPGATVYYYYQVTLAQPYQLDEDTVVSSWPMPDPRNLQVENRGIVESLLAPDVPELKEIVTTTDLKLRSVFNVPAPKASESLWVAKFDFPAGADGAYSVDTVVQYEGGLTRTIPNQMFTLDRTPPTASIAAAIGASAGLYERDDGSIVTAAHTDAGTLTITATPSEPAAYLYQIIELDADGSPSNRVWNPMEADDLLPITYMEPHEIQIPIGDVGNYGIRAVGVDSILNISSNTMPRRLDIVPPDPDVATMTLVHADYNGDGTTEGPFEAEQSADGATIFSDRSTVFLTFEMTEVTDHPLTSIAIDFQINGEGDWNPIALLTGDALAGAKAGFNVTWDRTGDFADRLDMRGQATVRVTVTNKLDIEGKSSVTFEIVPPALQLGGLSVNTGYEAGWSALQVLQGLDITALATNLLGVDPFSLLSPSPLPLALALLGMLNQIQGELPEGFETDDEQIHRENFGNGITPKPLWYAVASPDQRDSGRWINGHQLHLYTVAGPTADSVTFSISGAETAPVLASKVEAGGTYSYTFQLAEELVAIFAGSIPAFDGVTLMIDGHDPTPMAPGAGGVWEAQADLTPGYTVSYYYVVKLAQPYHDPLNDITITEFPLTAQQLQLADLGFAEALGYLLMSDLSSLGTMDPGLRSVFTVPAVDPASQSLWVGKLDFPADGMYALDVNVEYLSGSKDALTGKMFTVDRKAPEADITVHSDNPGENIGMYLRDADGTYVATALPNPGAARLNVSAVPIDDSDLEAYLYQFARLDDVTDTPGSWNPMLTLDLQGLDLRGELPLTLEQDVQMLVRSVTGDDLDYGTYGLRVVGIDNILNVDSSRQPGVRLELVAPDPDSAAVVLVQADHDGNGTTDAPYETQSADGAIIFSDSMVTLTVEITERTDHPLTIDVEYQVAGGEWHSIETLTEAATNAMLGDQLLVNWQVGDYAALPDTMGHVMVRTVATNGLTIERGRESPVSLAYERRLPPEIAAIHVDAPDLNPDSGGPRGTITVSAFTRAMTKPETTAIQFEVRRAADTDGEWQAVGVAQLLGDTTVVSNVQTPLIQDQIGAIVAGAPSVQLVPFYRQWLLTSVDTTLLEDTILDDTPAQTDASQDDNPYVVRARAVDVDGMGYLSADGVDADFSVDNYSPTEITQVKNEVEVVDPREDESYRVSGLLAEDVPEPMLELTARTGAYPGVFPGGIKLVVNDSDSGAVVAIPETVLGEAGNYTYIGDFNLASVENGIYTFRAVAYNADGTSEDRIDPKPITVEVRNFNPLTDILSTIVIDTEGDERTPAEIDAMYPVGFPTVDDQFTFTFTVHHVWADEIDVLIGDDGDSARALGALTDDGIVPTANADGSTSFEITLDTSMLDEDRFNLVGVVHKPNGSAPFDLPGIRVDRSGPVVTIVSPVSRHHAELLPTIQITYTDASGFDPTDMAMVDMPVEITLTRLPFNESVAVDVSRIRITPATVGEVLTQSGHIVYTHDDDLVGGAYRIGATVTDILGNVGTAVPIEFRVDSVKPTVSIVSPLIGVIVDPRQPLIISTALTGNGEITVTEFQINGVDVKGTLENNWLTYTMEPPLIDAADSILQRGSDNTVSVKIVDSEDRTAEGAISFAVSLDSTAPVISGPTPEGDVTRDMGQITAMVTDNESDITRIQLAVNDNPLQDLSFTPGLVVEVSDQTGFSFADAPLGTHSVTVVAESTGGTSSLTWTFNIVATEPTVVIASPLVGQIVDPRQPLIIDTALTGAGEITVTEFQINGVDVKGTLADNWLTYTMEPPLIGEADSILQRGSDNTVSVKIIDSEGRTAEGSASFAVSLDDTPPAISAPTPEGDVTRDMGQITAMITDNESDITRIQLAVNDNPLQDLSFTPGLVVEVSDQTGFSFADAPLGTHSVTVVAESTGGTSSLTWTFNIVATEPTVVIASPLVGQIVDPRQPLIIDTALTGAGEITVTEFQINGVDVKGTLADNWLTYTMEPPLIGEADSILQRGSDNTVSVKIIDSEGRTAEGSASFAVSLDDTPPAISAPTPEGDVTRDMGQITAMVTDNESDITRIQLAVNDNPLQDLSFTPGLVVEVSDQTGFSFADAPLGTHSVTVVAESTGGTSSLTWTFNIVATEPTVVIASPLVGQIVDPRQPLIIDTALTGAGEITVTEFQINGVDVEGTLADNWLTYTMEPPLIGEADSILRRGSDNTVSVKIIDSEGRTAEGSASFAVSLDDTPPAISAPTPEGDVTRDMGQITAMVTDNESDITRIQLAVNDNPLQDLSFTPGLVVEVSDQTGFSFADAPLGTHSVTVVAESTGGTSSLTWTFNIVAIEPTVVIASPLVGQIVDPRQPLIIDTALTGAGEITVTEFQINGVDVEGTLADNWLTYTMEPPLIGEADSILQRGSDNTVSVKIIDSEGRTAEGSASFAVSLDDTPPAISAPTPEGDVTRDMGQITAMVTDNESDITRIQLAVNDNPLQDLSFTPVWLLEVSDQTGFSFADAPLGTHSVTVVAESTGGTSSLTWTFNIVATEPTVVIASPLVGQIVDPRQPLTISAALTGAGEITVTEFQINGMDVEGTLADNWLTYTIEPHLVDAADSILQRGSDNTVSVKIIDSEGRTAEGSASFAVSLDNTPPAISGPSPKGDITRKVGRITATVTDNESDITRIQFAIDDNPLQDLSFTHGRVVDVGGGTEVQGQTNFNFFDAPLGTHTVTIVAESTGGTSTLTWEFTIVHPDTKPPEVVTYSPLGIIRTDRPVLAATVSDESGFARDGITLILAGVPGNQGSGRRSSPTSTTVTFTPSISVTPGPYTARLTVVDKYNNRTEAEWQFTVELDERPPSITTTAPHGVIRSAKPLITVSANDDMSGVDTIEIGLRDGNNASVSGITTVRSDKTAATFTPSGSLKDGTYTVEVKATDMRGNEAASKWQFTVELDTIPPSILLTRPSQEHTENRRPIISATYTDDMSGVDVKSVKLWLDGSVVEPDELSNTQVIFTPKFDLTFDQHTVKLEVSDTAAKPNTAVQEWTFYVERIGITDARNYPNPFDHETTIGFRISRQARITIQVYDFTGRLVAQPITNSVREAGLVEVEWHGETSGGEHLARGVYFCHILMESELEPQSAILKMAITRD